MTDLKIDPKNYRIHTDKNKRIIRKSLEDCGAGRSVLVDKDTIITTDYKKLTNNGDFKNESELKADILRNKESFCREILQVEYKYHIEECSLKRIAGVFDNDLFVDIVFVDTQNRNHFVELKNPKNGYNELMTGLGQCLAYTYVAEARNYVIGSVNLVTARHNNLVPLIIKNFNLPINYIYFDHSKFAIAGDLIHFKYASEKGK